MKKSKGLLVIMVIVLIIAGIMLGNYFLGVQKYQKTVAEMTFEDVDVSQIKDGTYVGECDVNYIYVKAEVTVQGGKIEKIMLLEHKNDRGATAESIVDEMIRGNTTDVDTVSGATNSSKVIKKAVENALIKRIPYE